MRAKHKKPIGPSAKPIPKVISFQDPLPEPQRYRPQADRILSGDPAQAAIKAMAPMQSGIVTISSRQVTCHRCRWNTRSIFRPAPMSAIITTTSVKRSVTSG